MTETPSHCPKTQIPLRAPHMARGAHLSQTGGGQPDYTRHALTSIPEPIQTHITTPKSQKTAKTHKIPAINTTFRRQHTQNRRRHSHKHYLSIDYTLYIITNSIDIIYAKRQYEQI